MIRSPHGICCSPDGQELFVTASEFGVNVLRISDGLHIRTITSMGNRAGKFKSLKDICISPDGKVLYVTENGADRVQVLNARDGAYIRVIKIKFPLNICLSLDGQELFVSSDVGEKCIQVFRVSDGKHVRDLGKGAFIRHPIGMCISHNGEIFAADYHDHKIQVINQEDGTVVRTINYHYPYKICILGDLLFLSDYRNSCIQVINAADGSHVRTIGREGTGVGQLKRPECISTHGDELYVADKRNNRVQVFQI